MAKSKPKHDPKTRKFLELWGRREVPTAQVAAEPIERGDYRAFAILGWIEKHGPAVICGLQMVVLKEEPLTNMGILTLGMPVTAKTELYVVKFLEDLGWDGRVWPYEDHGWPEGTDDEVQVVHLCAQAELGCTLTFKPDEGGAPAVPIRVAKSRDPYPLAPFESEVVEGSLSHLEAFRALVEDPSPFVLEPDEPPE